MNSRKLIALFVVCSLSVPTFSQMSGGQVKRNTHKPRTEVRKYSKPKSLTSQTEQNAPTYTHPAIQPISMSSLTTYNVVVNTFRILTNAQGLCQKLRDEGWGAQIYLDSSNMYRVLMVGSNQEPEAVLYRNHARQTYPNAWILKIENGHESRYEY